MNKVWWLALIPGMLVVMAIVLVVALLLIEFLWAWTIPDLFPGAVKQGLVADRIGWLTALKLAFFVAVLAAMARGALGARKE